MGTSRSSSGPSSGVPLVPSWVNGGTTQDLQSPAAQPDAGAEPSQSTPSAEPLQNPQPISPVASQGRFSTARRLAGEFVRTGNTDSLGRALGSYARKGYGGSRNVTRRMSQASATSSKAYSILSGLADGSITPESIGIDREKLRDRPVSDVIDAIVDAICREDTTIDDVSSREAVNDALCDALNENPDMNLLSPTAEFIDNVWVRSFSYNVVEIVMKDIGSHIQKSTTGDHAKFNDICRQVKEFIFERMRGLVEVKEKDGLKVNSKNCHSISEQVMRETFEIFDGGDDD